MFGLCTDIVKLTAQEWEKADITIREQLEADYKREMVDFMAAQVKYDKMLTNEQREEIKKAKVDIAESKEKRMLRKVMSICVCVHIKSKAAPLYAMEALGGRGGIAPTHSRPRH
jgi:hypothetical protein